MDTQKMIARLLAGESRGAFACGRRAGAEWAEHTATADMLRRLAGAAARAGFGAAGGFDGVDPDPAVAVAAVATGRKPGVVDAGEFWAGAVPAAPDPDEAGDPLFARGFVAGAVAAWQEVEAEVGRVQ